MPSAHNSESQGDTSILFGDADSRESQAGRAVSVCLIGGKNLFRHAIGQLLDGPEIEVVGTYADEQHLVEAQRTGRADSFDLVLMILSRGVKRPSPPAEDVPAGQADQPPLVVLSEELSRGGIYSAIRMGAKAYVTLDSEPNELRRAIMLAAKGRMHLSHDAAELMINEITAGPQGRQNSREHSIAALSPRETEVVELLCEGLSSKQIAHRLHLAPKTIENHRYNIYRKCKVESIAGLIRYAVQNGIISL